jgi:PAS domain S-box-containing protein
MHSKKGITVRQRNTGSFSLVYCADPLKAVEVARHVKPTAVLQDLIMPGVDGLTLVRQYRADPLTKDIPIIVLSTKEEPAVKSDAFAAGANDYLVKLPDKIELIARVRYHSKAYVSQLQRDVAYRALREREQELRASEERFRTVFETAADAIVSSDSNGKVTGLNGAAERLFGYARGELIGQPLSVLLPEQFCAEHWQVVRRPLETGEGLAGSAPVEVFGKRKDGSEVPLEVALAAWRMGDAVLVTGIMRDVTTRKEIEQLRTDFLAMLAHDIKTPLTAIVGGLELLQDIDVNPAAREFIDIISGNTQTLLSLVTNYLQVSTIELGHLTLCRRAVILSDLLEHVVAAYQIEARRQRVTLASEFEPALPPVDGDPVALDRIFANLVHNALKFTPEGGLVAVSARRDQDSIAVTVTNTGPGIELEEIPTLFRRFGRTATGRTGTGTGMGLFIVKSLAEAHGGTVEVESTPGSSTSFSVFLPLVSPSADTQAPPAEN